VIVFNVLPKISFESITGNIFYSMACFVMILPYLCAEISTGFFDNYNKKTNGGFSTSAELKSRLSDTRFSILQRQTQFADEHSSSEAGIFLRFFTVRRYKLSYFFMRISCLRGCIFYTQYMLRTKKSVDIQFFRANKKKRVYLQPIMAIN
jgi:hypothetical protein